ncbi:AAA family ATPase [Enterococcus diestrammenae]|uniref:Nuclease SbcCD subunit C n=1 Tax=Enterococcus diestrammenae TaxID=1155073 RepID=A0ABV0F443_9ENTE|nr:AAA family ATPase [Enterococcus diestrammenae]KAF1298205.1 hypothetical protein BAU18_06670 [Enterococcus diestrammenae]
MIFKKIVLQNFRQYEGKVSIRFGTEDGKITLIVARNGVGKTTLLQAFRFCFYGESPNVLILPSPDELLNYNVFERMDEASKIPLSVSVEFEHQSVSYLAIREVNIMKNNGRMKIVKESTFSLKEQVLGKGFREVPDAKQRINEMMPPGLAHVYMFDGERVEKPIESNTFRNDFKESIIGILGLKKMSVALEFLGDRAKSSTVIGKINRMIEPQTVEQDQILKTQNSKIQKIETNKNEILDLEKNISTLNFEIQKAEVEQKQVIELQSLLNQRDSIDAKMSLVEIKINQDITDGCRISCKLIYLIQLAKTYQTFKEFEDSKEESKELFSGLYDTVIRDVLEKKRCICGRCVEPGSQEAEYIKGLSALPNDNAQYLNQLNQMYSELDESPELISKLERIKVNLAKLKKEKYGYQSEFEKIIDNIKDKERELGNKKNQTNVDSLKKTKYFYERKIQELLKENNDAEKFLSSVKSQIKKIREISSHNKKVNDAIEDLEDIVESIKFNLIKRQGIAKESIEENMNVIISQVMSNNLKAKIGDDYSLKIFRNIPSLELNSGKDETAVLSTGQKIMVYLSFLRALLMTVENHSEFEKVQSGVIMDAALSNVDERHIALTCKYILNDFDQLIFLSFRKQLRNELIEGIKDNISVAYELSKNDDGSVVVQDLDKNKLIDYINKGALDDE